jgi:hypothetical protein
VTRKRPALVQRLQREVEDAVVGYIDHDAVTALIAPPVVKRYPTVVTVRCDACRHKVDIAIFLEDVNKLVCKRCGAKEPTLIGRNPMQQWSQRRMRGNMRASKRGKYK